MKRTDILETLSNLINCSNCSCCDSGAVYVLSHELEKLKVKGIEVIDFYGAYFIPRKEGVCIYYSNPEKKCEIYPDRPICCRIFPFDILYYIELGLWWAVFRKCNRVMSTLSEPITRRTIKLILREFETSMDEKLLIDFYRKERATLIVERGEKLENDYLLISPITRKCPGIQHRPIKEFDPFCINTYPPSKFASMLAFRPR